MKLLYLASPRPGYSWHLLTVLSPSMKNAKRPVGSREGSISPPPPKRKVQSTTTSILSPSPPSPPISSADRVPQVMQWPASSHQLRKRNRKRRPGVSSASPFWWPDICMRARTLSKDTTTLGVGLLALTSYVPLGSCILRMPSDIRRISGLHPHPHQRQWSIPQRCR